MSDNSYVLNCAWLIRCGESPKANQRLTIVNGVLQEMVNVPADEMSLIQPIAVMPGFVNAHTHLEFSDLAEPLKPPSPFPDWIRSVVKYRRADLGQEAAIRHAVEAGVEECKQAGTSVIGEICTSDIGRDALVNGVSHSQTAAVCFRELLGFTSNRVTEQNQMADAFVASFSDAADDVTKVVPGLSPHAPYSVHPQIVQHACTLSRTHHLPIAMHLAETIDEVEFIESQSGRFVDFLDGIGLWQPESLNGIRRIADYLNMLKSGGCALAIHGNYFSDRDVKLLGQSSNIKTVYCVRTHRWFGHLNHPWKQIEAAGGAVVLGTDSRASNPDLSIWKELQTFCQMHPEQSLIARLPMISTDSAAAIGLQPASVNLQLGSEFNGTVVSTTATTETALNSSFVHPTAKVRSASEFAKPI